MTLYLVDFINRRVESVTEVFTPEWDSSALTSFEGSSFDPGDAA